MGRACHDRGTQAENHSEPVKQGILTCYLDGCFPPPRSIWMLGVAYLSADDVLACKMLAAERASMLQAATY